MSIISSARGWLTMMIIIIIKKTFLLPPREVLSGQTGRVTPITITITMRCNRFANLIDATSLVVSVICFQVGKIN